MKHKFLAVLLALVAALCLCFGLVACNGNEGENPEGENPSTETDGDKDKDKESDKETDKGIAGKTFVFYEVKCEGMDADLLEEYRVNNQTLTYSFATDGTATSTASMHGMTVETHLTYTVNGNEVTLTTVSMTMNGKAQEIPTPAPTAKGTYDGTALTCVSTTQAGLTLIIVLHEKAAS